VDEAEGAYFSSIIDAAPDGMLIVDGDGVITFANRQAVQLFKIHHDELVGASVDRLLPLDLQSTHRAHRLRYRAEPSVRPMGVGLLLRARRGDGTEFPVEISLSPLARGDEFQVVAAVRDVTARIEADDQMRRVLRTLDATEDAVFILDAATLRFTYANAGAARQVGYSVDELLGMTPMHIDPERTEADLRQLIDEVRNAGDRAVNVRGMHRRRDGTDVPIEMSLRTAPTSQDGTVSVITVARDISERLAADERLQRSRQALREAEQSMAIADDRERIARDLHDTVIQRLFASGLALQAVTNRVDPDLRVRLDTVVDDLDQTIRDIRSAIFSLQSSGPADDGVGVRILEVVRQATDSVGFEPRLQFDGPIETTDEDVVEQLLPTLREALTNIAKHAQASTVRVTIEATGGHTQMVVVDDGVGLPDDAGGGNGLGNMRNRAELLGGTMTVEDAPPHGTRLVWTVPVDRS
jgi:PAS domain S-box-containing protein